MRYLDELVTPITYEDVLNMCLIKEKCTDCVKTCCSASNLIYLDYCDRCKRINERCEQYWKENRS